MEPSTTYYVYDENNQVIEIRTKLMTGSVPKYIIQYPSSRKSPNEKIRYRYQIVSEETFYNIHS